MMGFIPASPGFLPSTVWLAVSNLLHVIRLPLFAGKAATTSRRMASQARHPLRRSLRCFFERVCDCVYYVCHPDENWRWGDDSKVLTWTCHSPKKYLGTHVPAFSAPGSQVASAKRPRCFSGTRLGQSSHFSTFRCKGWKQDHSVRQR